MSDMKKTCRGKQFRLFSLETLLALAGLALLVLGIVDRRVMGIFWGVIILGGLLALHLVRKKDWEKHWQEQDKKNDNRQP